MADLHGLLKGPFCSPPLAKLHIKVFLECSKENHDRDDFVDSKFFLDLTKFLIYAVFNFSFFY